MRGWFYFFCFFTFILVLFLPCLSVSSPLLSLLSLFSLSLGGDTKWRTRVDVSLNPITTNIRLVLTTIKFSLSKTTSKLSFNVNPESFIHSSRRLSSICCINCQRQKYCQALFPQKQAKCRLLHCCMGRLPLPLLFSKHLWKGLFSYFIQRTGFEILKSVRTVSLWENRQYFKKSSAENCIHHIER